MFLVILGALCKSPVGAIGMWDVPHYLNLSLNLILNPNPSHAGGMTADRQVRECLSVVPMLSWLMQEPYFIFSQQVDLIHQSPGH